MNKYIFDAFIFEVTQSAKRRLMGQKLKIWIQICFLKYEFFSLFIYVFMSKVEFLVCIKIYFASITYVCNICGRYVQVEVKIF